MALKTLQNLAAKIPVTGFLDYRDYLRDLYAQAKAETSPYSYLLFAQDLGCGSTNALRLVIVRQRQLSDNSARTIAESLGLRHEFRRYFLAAVKYGNARSPAAKERHFRKMLETKQATMLSGKERDQLSYYTEWYHPVVREMTRLRQFVPDPKWMAERLYPALGATEIRKSLALLESLGLITIDATKGIQTVKDGPMVMPSDATAGHMAISRYHQTMIEMAKSAVVDVPEDQAEFNALTVNLSVKEFEELRERVREFCAEVMARDGKDQPRERVAQINIQLFSLIKPEGKRS